MNIKAPQSGYDHPEKQSYRERVWAALAPAAIRAIRQSERAVVVLMPSMEGLEIKAAISHGVPEERIVCVDSSPAKIATSKWRREHPNCMFYGSMMSVAVEKMLKDGLHVCAANLDFCTNFSLQLIHETNSLLSLHEETLRCWSVTVAKGRESTALTQMVKKFGLNDALALEDQRIGALISLLEQRISPFASVISEGSYRISKTQMCWTAFDTGIEAEKNINVIAKESAEVAKRIYKFAVWADGTQNRFAERLERRMIDEDKIELQYVYPTRRNYATSLAQSWIKKLAKDCDACAEKTVKKPLSRTDFQAEVRGKIENAWRKEIFTICPDPGHLFRRARKEIVVGGQDTRIRSELESKSK